MSNPAAKAALLRNAICLTTAVPRPAPTLFYFPGLTGQAIWHHHPKGHDGHSSTLFPWIQNLIEPNFHQIQSEFLAFQQQEQQHMSSPSNDYHLDASNQKEHQLHSGEWHWNAYMLKGKIQPKFKQAFPQTSALLADIPNLMTQVPFGYSFFSSLKPQSSIKAHSAPMNIRLRCHLPIVVPKEGGCGLRVGSDVCEWTEGQCLVFDDSYDHEAWHDGHTKDRVILLFDIWHPDLHESEIQALKDMFSEQHPPQHH